MRSALVTGASRGIGRGIALSLARQAYGLTITSRNAEDLADLEPLLRDAGAPVVVHQAADMSEPDAVPDLVRLHKDAFETMSALILNAGVGTAGEIAAYPRRRLAKTLDVNFVSPFVLVGAALPLLREWASHHETGARVIALSSITGVYAEPGLAVYGASKAALLSMIDTLNCEESGHGITASAVAPAYVETDMSAWATDAVPPTKMIPVSDVVAVVDLLLGLSRNSAVTRVVMARSGTTGYQA